MILPEDVAASIVGHCRSAAPVEACGIIVGPAGIRRPARVIRMDNALESQTRFAFDPGEQLAVWQEVEDDGDEVVAVYHSHTRGAAYPSKTDVDYAQPDLWQVIVEVGCDRYAIRVFRIVDGRVEEEPVELGPGVDAAGTGGEPVVLGDDVTVNH